MLAGDEFLNGGSFNFGPNAEQNQSVVQLINEISPGWSFKKDFSRYHIREQEEMKEAGLLKLNCDKALARLQWMPTMNFTETSATTIRWYDAYYNSKNINIEEYTLQQLNEYLELAKTRNLAWTK